MIQIEELILQIPRLSKEESRLLTEEVVQKIAASLPEDSGASRYINELQIRLTAQQSWSRNRLAESIAEQIIKQLKIATL